MVANELTIEVSYRVRGTEKNFGVESWKSEKKVVKVKTPEELFEIFKPTILSENLRNAVNEFFSGKRNLLRYNFGKGNALFYFA